MKTLRTTLAVALLGLALTAFQSDALAQTRGGGSGSRSSSSASRSSSTTSRSSSTSRSTSATKSASASKSASGSKSTSVSRPSSSQSSKPVKVNPSSVRSTEHKSVSRPAVSTSTDKKPGQNPGHQPSTSVSRPGPGSSTKPSTKPSTPSVNKPQTQKPGNKPATVTRPAPRPGDKKPGGPAHQPSKPVQVRPDHKPDPHRVHPRDRDFMRYNKPSYFWTGHNHYYGHRVRVLPSYAHRHVYHGVTYYCYNDIWYRPYGGYYVVCRPPFGTVLAANLIADMTWAAINFSYYNTVSQTYSQINENNEYIAQQNALIAQNNAIIAAQNAQIASGQQQAQMAYTLANELGLIQSYAAAGSAYYYQDGVFYTMDASGQYSVIVPPAGALIETLPEDYDLVTLADGNQYYKVDDTVYKVTIVEGKPYFEVLGQLYN